MPILVNEKTYNILRFSIEAEFEKVVEQLADNIFGTSTIYIPRKKKIKNAGVVSIPDAYLVDMTNPVDPSLYIIENEIISHDPFKHIGIQLLKFATGFDSDKQKIRNYLMEFISKDKNNLKRLNDACLKSKSRNIDAYLDSAVYKDFKAIVVIDEATDDLHNVIQKINANISVLELRSFISDTKNIVYHFDTLYDENDEVDVAVMSTQKARYNYDEILKLRDRRAQCDTVVVPAKEDGFKKVFLGQNSWFSIRISAAMKDRIKYIAAYQVAPISAITHIAEVDAIVPYQNTGKYLVKFKGPAREIPHIKPRKSSGVLQGPTYIKYDDLQKAKCIDDLLVR